MEKNKNLKEIVIKIEGEKWEKALDMAFKKANAKAKIDGFRPGKAPKNVFLKHYGVESLFMDASNYAVEDAYNQMIEENKDLEIAAQPVLDIRSIDEKYIEYVFTITLKPEVKLGKYKGLNVKKEAVKVTKKEIEEAVDHMREHYKENVVKEGKVENGDIAVIDFEGFKDGVAFEGGKSENYSLEIGSGQFIPGFEPQMVGMAINEEKVIDVKFPEDYHAADLAGKEAQFKIVLHEIKKRVTPELTDEFVKEELEIENVNNVEEYKAFVKEVIEKEKTEASDNKLMDDLVNAVVNNAKVEIPNGLIDEEVNHQVRQIEAQAKMYGLTADVLLQYSGVESLEAYKNTIRPAAEMSVKQRVVFFEIAKAEKIKISAKEYNDELKVIAKEMKASVEEAKARYTKESLTPYLQLKKVNQLIKEAAIIK